jgi:hypothetical protein
MKVTRTALGERRISEIRRRRWIAVSDGNRYSGLTEDLGK